MKQMTTTLAALMALMLVWGCGREVASGQDEPEAVQTDLRTPQSAAKSFFDALEKGNAEAAKGAAVTTDDQEQALDAMAHAMSGFRELHRAAVDRFGEEGKEVGGDMHDPELREKINRATVTEDGDTAVLRTEEEEDEPLRLRRVDGQWKVDLQAMMEEHEEDITAAVPMFRAMGSASREIAADIREGKFENAEEAQREMGMRMMAAMFGAMQEQEGQPGQPQPQPEPAQPPQD